MHRALGEQGQYGRSHVAPTGPAAASSWARSAPTAAAATPKGASPSATGPTAAERATTEAAEPLRAIVIGRSAAVFVLVRRFIAACISVVEQGVRLSFWEYFIHFLDAVTIYRDRTFDNLSDISLPRTLVARLRPIRSLAVRSNEHWGPEMPSLRRAAIGCLALALVAGCSGSSGGGEAKVASTTTTAAKASTTTTTTDLSAAPVGAVAKGPAVPSAGCGITKAAAQSAVRHEIGDRFYLLTTPPGQDGTKPLPLVLDLHGLSEGAAVHSVMTKFGPYAAENGFIALVPNGSGTPVKWDVSLDRKTNPDLVFLDAALDQVEKDQCVDTSRVYSTGLSYGAIMSSTLGCVMTDRIAAIAPVDGLTVPRGCKPDRAIPVLTFHGTQDPILLFNGGVANLGNILGEGGAKTKPPAKVDLNGPGYPAAAAAWAKQNGCTGKPIDTNRTPTIIERTWDCPAASPMVFEIMVGAGHSWPGSEFSQSIASVVGPTDMSIVGDDLIWQFFQRFQLGAQS